MDRLLRRCETPEVLAKLEKWLRRRFGRWSWKQWKRELRDIESSAARHRCADAGKTAGAPMDRGTLRTRPALKIALSTLTSLARTSRPHGSWLVRPAEPPDADRMSVVWQGRVGDHSPMPIVTRAKLPTGPRMSGCIAQSESVSESIQ